jgi:chitinase
MKKILFCLFVVNILSIPAFTQQGKSIAVIGYFAGPAKSLENFPIQKLTHINFSFVHLKDGKLSVDRREDSVCINKMVSYKESYPWLKVILSLGGWGGCKDCSAVFATEKGRADFAKSVKETMQYFKTDGIDLDWEYPAIPGYPGHEYMPADRQNFTSLVKLLRKELGRKYEISFAAGGSDHFIDSSIEWKEVMKIVDKVNVMSYDLVHGNSKVSGHHTPLYSTPEQKESGDNAVMRLIQIGVPANKIILGAAFYARMFEVSDTNNHGLYRSAQFYHGISYSHLYDTLTAANGFVQYWDPVANAPYAFNAQRKLEVTYDDSLSIALKTKYVISKGLGGIMFWQLAEDRLKDGLLDAIDRTKKTAMSSLK